MLLSETIQAIIDSAKSHNFAKTTGWFFGPHDAPTCLCLEGNIQYGVYTATGEYLMSGKANDLQKSEVYEFLVEQAKSYDWGFANRENQELWVFNDVHLENKTDLIAFLEFAKGRALALEPEPEPEPKTSEVIYKAIEGIRANGWATKTGWFKKDRPNNCLCLEGGLQYGDGYDFYRDGYGTWRNNSKAYKAVFANSGLHDTEDLYDYNDAPGRTQDDVLDLLRRTAKVCEAVGD